MDFSRTNIRFEGHCVRTLESAGLTERSLFDVSQIFKDKPKEKKKKAVETPAVNAIFSNQGLESYYIKHGANSLKSDNAAVRDPMHCFLHESTSKFARKWALMRKNRIKKHVEEHRFPPPTPEQVSAQRAEMAELVAAAAAVAAVAAEAEAAEAAELASKEKEDGNRAKAEEEVHTGDEHAPTKKKGKKGGKKGGKKKKKKTK
jgi:hypothetical protein